MTKQDGTKFDVIVIGGGQAGLSVGYHLARRGLRFVILDGHGRIGDAWRKRWDSLRLFSPARHDGLDGMPFPAPPTSCPTKDEMADYLEAYAAHFELPVLTGVTVSRLSRVGAFAFQPGIAKRQQNIHFAACGECRQCLCAATHDLIKKAQAVWGFHTINCQRPAEQRFKAIMSFQHGKLSGACRNRFGKLQGQQAIAGSDLPIVNNLCERVYHFFLKNYYRGATF